MSETATKILIVDDDRFVRMALVEALRTWQYETVEADSVASAKKMFADEEPGIVLLDIDLPDGSGLDVLNEIKEISPDTIAVMITGNVDVGNTVAALRGGAHDFIGKPVRIEELRVTLRNALETHSLRREVRHARNERARGFSFSEIVGESEPLKKAMELGTGSPNRTFHRSSSAARPGRAKTFLPVQSTLPPSGPRLRIWR